VGVDRCHLPLCFKEFYIRNPHEPGRRLMPEECKTC
jgi:hypothetical protein